MKALWLVARLFSLSLGAGWLLSIGFILLCLHIGAGVIPLFVLWVALGFARWYYVHTYNQAAFAYMHNLLHSTAQLWVTVCAFEFLPWFIFLFTFLFYALGGR